MRKIRGNTVGTNMSPDKIADRIGGTGGCGTCDVTETITTGTAFEVLDKSYPYGTYSKGYIKSGGGIATSATGYGTFYFEATKDFECYFDLAEVAQHSKVFIGIFNTAPGNENSTASVFFAKSDEGTLPTEDNKLSVAEGQYVAVSFDRAKVDNFALYQNMTTEVVTKKCLKDDICLADTQIDQVLNKFAPIVSKEGGMLSIWLPLKRKNGYYAHFTFELAEKASINQNIWKFNKFVIVDGSFNDIFAPQTGLEWTSVVMEKDAADYVGGYHGDEIMDVMSIFLDGKELFMDGEDFGKKNFTELKIVIKSTVNRCDTPGENLFTRYQDIVLSADGIHHTNRWIALADVTIKTAYLGMMGFYFDETNPEAVQYCRYNDGYAAQPAIGEQVPGSCFDFSNYANVFEMWSDNYLARLTVLETNFSSYKDTGNPTSARVKRTDDICCVKAYYQNNGTLNLTSGNELRGKWKHEFI